MSPLIILVIVILLSVTSCFGNDIFTLFDSLFHTVYNLRDNNRLEILWIVVVLLNVFSAQNEFEPIFDLGLSSAFD